MNYRHIYHAGNFADVFKHAVLLHVLNYLKQKDKGFFALDTHGGLGVYDLRRLEAEKTKEWMEGIGKIWVAENLPAPLQSYRDFVAHYNKAGTLSRYPGSPEFIAAALRPQDRAAFVELHPEDYKIVSTRYTKNESVTVLHEDGYTALRALLPPPERRGLVLIDPPFEKRDEFKTMAKALQGALKRWATGIYLLWYPIKDIRHVDAFYQEISGLVPPEKLLRADYLLQKPVNSDLLNGSGLAIINPPWGLEDAVKACRF